MAWKGWAGRADSVQGPPCLCSLAFGKLNGWLTSSEHDKHFSQRFQF